MDVMPDLVILLGIQPNRKSFKPPVPYRLDAIDFSQHTIGCSRPVIKVSAHGKHVMSSSPVPLKEPRVFLSSVGRVDDHGLPHRHLDVLKSSFFKLICQASNCESSRYISLKLLSKPSLYFTYVPGLPASLKNESSCRPSGIIFSDADCCCAVVPGKADYYLHHVPNRETCLYALCCPPSWTSGSGPRIRHAYGSEKQQRRH
ncbi:hypothetical protein TNCV_876841 [Trichonephila clavipes]|nr:hypothetical protein TNCV_876841 [Trichonephila clavipes]